MKPINAAVVIILALLAFMGIAYAVSLDIQVVVLGLFGIPLLLNSVPWGLANAEDDEPLSEEELDALLEQRRLLQEERNHMVQGIGFNADLKSQDEK